VCACICVCVCVDGRVTRHRLPLEPVQNNSSLFLLRDPSISTSFARTLCPLFTLIYCISDSFPSLLPFSRSQCSSPPSKTSPTVAMATWGSIFPVDSFNLSLWAIPYLHCCSYISGPFSSHATLWITYIYKKQMAYSKGVNHYTEKDRGEIYVWSKACYYLQRWFSFCLRLSAECRRKASNFAGTGETQAGVLGHF
jgi:hypothetical protein